ncbi:MAG TPA: hypothetical protein P5107_00030 [Thermotogota bacterium]|nr:hypothetical protein [Thermotogota bacterium]HRW33424.1 hypothetical protein [Thermotogota bacterium]
MNDKVDEMKKYFCVLLLLFSVVISLSAQYSEDYFGLSLEYYQSNLSFFGENEWFDDYDISFVVTYGPSFSGPFRFRLGGGVHDLSDYYVNAGIEFKVLEFLNAVKGRLFGLYINADLKMGLDYMDASIKGSMYIPFSAVGGLQIGLGINHNIQPSLIIAYTGGIYPLIMTQ